MKLDKLYPAVEFPVSKGTPMISPLIRWEHSEDWYVTSYQMQEKIKSGERTVGITLKDDELEYLSGHVIDGRNLYPATGYLVGDLKQAYLLTNMITFSYALSCYVDACLGNHCFNARRYVHRGSCRVRECQV